MYLHFATCENDLHSKNHPKYWEIHSLDALQKSLYQIFAADAAKKNSASRGVLWRESRKQMMRTLNYLLPGTLIQTDSFRRGAPSKRHSRSLRALTMMHQTRGLRPPVPTSLLTQVTRHVSCAGLTAPPRLQLC